MLLPIRRFPARSLKHLGIYIIVTFLYGCSVPLSPPKFHVPPLSLTAYTSPSCSALSGDTCHSTAVCGRHFLFTVYILEILSFEVKCFHKKWITALHRRENIFNFLSFQVCATEKCAGRPHINHDGSGHMVMMGFHVTKVFHCHGRHILVMSVLMWYSWTSSIL